MALRCGLETWLHAMSHMRAKAYDEWSLCNCGGAIYKVDELIQQRAAVWGQTFESSSACFVTLHSSLNCLMSCCTSYWVNLCALCKARQYNY